ncbi:MAG: Uma2 family endonuclease [Propylenella sp.]
MTVLAKQKPQDAGSGLWTADQFLDFYMTRPDEERWQLVDGLAMMMVPANFLHQRLTDNFKSLLKEALKAKSRDLYPFENVGLRIPGVRDFNPQPDIAVCRADLAREYYADSFFLAAEVISPSNTAEMIGRKVELYRSHPDNLYCLTIDQDSVHVALWSREDAWARTDLRSLDDVLGLPAFGFEAKLTDVYEGTPLAP